MNESAPLKVDGDAESGADAGAQAATSLSRGRGRVAAASVASLLLAAGVVGLLSRSAPVADGRTRAASHRSAQPVSAASEGDCSQAPASCLESKCCVGRGHFCYQKNDTWAGCRATCNLGVYEKDPADSKTTWSCTMIDTRPLAHALAPAPLAEPPSSAPSTPSNVAWRKGCKNWKEILMKTISGVASREACNAHCGNLKGCLLANYQVHECDDGYAEGQCNLYGGTCEEEDNDCWDLVNLSGPAIVPTAHRMGCKNFENIKLGDPTFHDNQYQCVNECAATNDCTSVNYQPGACSGEEMVGKGACYMFGSVCEKIENPCWDLYEGVGGPVR